jgi:hypothetical protein
MEFGVLKLQRGGVLGKEGIGVLVLRANKPAFGL